MQNARALPQTAFDPSRGYLESLQERPVAPAVDARALRLTLNREALGSIHTAHYPHVLKVCRRFFRHSEDAEDAAAEVFLKLHAVLEKKNQKYPFRSWVCQVAGRHCGKREKRWIVVGNDLCALPDVFTPSPLSQVLHYEANAK